MKKRPSLMLREPVKLYDQKKEEPLKSIEIEQPKKIGNDRVELRNVENVKKIENETKLRPKESIKEKLPPRISQIWSYFCQKAKTEEGVNPVFSLTRAEVMKEAGIGSTNTYRDALKRFQDLGLLEIELRPGVNSGSIFTLTEKGISEIE